MSLQEKILICFARDLGVSLVFLLTGFDLVGTRKNTSEKESETLPRY